MASLAERLELHSIPEPTSGCTLWTGALFPNGYGRVHTHRGSDRAHRAAWFVAFGEIPTGLLVRHSCNNPVCINPTHLKLGTDADNAQDRERARRSRHFKPTCKRGHPLTGGNVYSVPSYPSGRRCRACRKK